jgi:hypothetical protein
LTFSVGFEVKCNRFGNTFLVYRVTVCVKIATIKINPMHGIGHVVMIRKKSNNLSWRGVFIYSEPLSGKVFKILHPKYKI